MVGWALPTINYDNLEHGGQCPPYASINYTGGKISIAITIASSRPFLDG